MSHKMSAEEQKQMKRAERLLWIYNNWEKASPADRDMYKRAVEGRQVENSNLTTNTDANWRLSGFGG